MKNIKTILEVLIIASFLFASCGQNSSKQKELELKERQLALKEKELALKEKGLSGTDSLIQKTSPVSNNPTAFNSKTNTENKEQAINNVGAEFLGLWKYDDDAFIKITKNNSGRFQFQDGYTYENKDENSIIWMTDDNVYPKLINGKLEGKYSFAEGSSPETNGDIKFSIALKSGNKLLYKRERHTMSGYVSKESFGATKIK